MKTQVNYQIKNEKLELFIQEVSELGLNVENFVFIDRDFWTNIYINASEKKHLKIEKIEELI